MMQVFLVLFGLLFGNVLIYLRFLVFDAKSCNYRGKCDAIMVYRLFLDILSVMFLKVHAVYYVFCLFPDKFQLFNVSISALLFLAPIFTLRFSVIRERLIPRLYINFSFLLDRISVIILFSSHYLKC